MIYITKRPEKYDELNNFDLRSDFENEEDEPVINTHLKDCGRVNDLFEAFAIDQYDEDREVIYQRFLYTSKNEYEQDCKILGL